ncbi:MAG: hypothetical protein NTX86_01105 [Candidatus Dependentiae bacterium]|nr:hypothetical protein [Candidatus Dependentiae bacterium]
MKIMHVMLSSILLITSLVCVDKTNNADLDNYVTYRINVVEKMLVDSQDPYCKEDIRILKLTNALGLLDDIEIIVKNNDLAHHKKHLERIEAARIQAYILLGRNQITPYV